METLVRFKYTANAFRIYKIYKAILTVPSIIQVCHTNNVATVNSFLKYKIHKAIWNLPSNSNNIGYISNAVYEPILLKASDFIFSL